MTTALPTSSRQYGGDNDFALMREFLSAAAAACPPQAYYHPGDLAWNLYRNPELDPRSEVRLWQDRDGNLLGFAWLEEPDGVVMQVRPDLRGAGILEEPMHPGVRSGLIASAGSTRGARPGCSSLSAPIPPIEARNSAGW